MATAAPPLGPTLGQRNINVQQFCKEFNERTSGLLPGQLLVLILFAILCTPLLTRVMANPKERTYEMDICTPPSTWLLKRAAGVKKGTEYTAKVDICGMLSVKHIYEIAKLKQKDRALSGTPLQV